MKLNPWSAAASVGAICAATLLLLPAPASACGGFFCNQVPIDQSGEHILFSVEDDGTIEAHVQIQYQGPSEDFAWIVPTPSRPEVGVGTATLFTRLTQLLQPQFILEWQEIGECRDDFLEDDLSPTAGGGDGGEPDRGGVDVVETGEVGPYDFAVLQATDTEELFVWLQENEFFIPDDVQPFVDPYVMMGNEIHFVAFKLSKDSDAGDIQPVTLRYDGSEPMIPIQLTAIATTPDMGVTAHVLGDTRAVPDNYLHVHINDARIDWLNGGWNYDEIVTEAMNEAGGQGFYTEFAGPTAQLEGSFYTEGQYDLEYLATVTDPIEFFFELQNQGFSGDAQLLGLLQDWIPFPQELADQGLRPQDFYNCLECYSEYIDREAFDAQGFADALGATIVEPLMAVQEMFDRQQYITRMYTTLSAEEMTLDPVFVFNSSMDDVSNIHRATAIVDCGDGGSRWDADEITIRLEDGRSFVTYWSDDRAVLDGLPAAETVEETGASGAPVLVESNETEIDIALDDLNEDRGVSPRTPQGGGCTSAPTRGGGALGAIGLLALAIRRRR